MFAGSRATIFTSGPGFSRWPVIQCRFKACPVDFLTAFAIFGSLFALLARPHGKAGINCFHIKAFGIKICADPICDFLVFGVGWIGQDLKFLGISPGTTAIFGRTSAGSFEAHRNEIRLQRQHLFQEEFVLPAVAKVVLVFEFGLWRQAEIADSIAPLIQSALAKFDFRLRSGKTLLPESKFVQVTIVPSHGGLDQLVELVERNLVRYKDTTPDLGPNVLQRKLELIDRWRIFFPR